jgi:peptide/nickel transport system permease protein
VSIRQIPAGREGDGSQAQSPDKLTTATTEQRSLYQDVWRSLRRNKSALAGGVILVLLLFVGVFAPWVSPYDPNYQFEDGLESLGTPVKFSSKFWLGTDTLGRDLLSRLIWGMRVSLVVGITANGIATIFALAVGSMAGYWGGSVENIIMRITDVVMSIPYLLFSMAIVAILSPSIEVLILIIAAFLWTFPARVFFGQTVSIKQREFVLAARCVGVRRGRIVLRHILPHLVSTFLVFFALGTSAAIMAETALSYLGLGVRPPTPSLGSMVSEGQTYFTSDPRLVLLPGLVITLTIVSISLFGDGLEEALNPWREKR